MGVTIIILSALTSVWYNYNIECIDVCVVQS